MSSALLILVPFLFLVVILHTKS
ncbi:hypothetical protein [Nitrosotalea sinensis]